MAEVKIQRDTKIIIALDEQTAEQLNQVLWECLDHDSFPQLRDLANDLSVAGVGMSGVVIAYDPLSDMFARDHDAELEENR